MPSVEYGSIWASSEEYLVARSICPELNCDRIHATLEARSDLISAIPIADPSRQLLAALRWRTKCIQVPAYAERDRLEGITFWLAIQGGSPLAA